MGLLREGFPAEDVAQMARQERGSRASPEGKRKGKHQSVSATVFASSGDVFLPQVLQMVTNRFRNNEHLVLLQVCLFFLVRVGVVLAVVSYQ